MARMTPGCDVTVFDALTWAELNMDVPSVLSAARIMALVGCLHLGMSALALADPMYTAIDLGTGNVSYGVDSSGNGTITGSNGQTYAFNPVQNYLSAQWRDTTQGIPTVEPPPVGNPFTYGDPKFAVSYSTLDYMNSRGLAVGINTYGVSGHLVTGEVFLTQQQPNGSWGPGSPLWSGFSVQDGGGGPSAAIMGISSNGQVLGWGALSPESIATTMYLYNAKTGVLTNMTNLIDSLPGWTLNSPAGQLDNDGRILVQADLNGNWQSPHNLLLIPDGLSPGPVVAAPEPATWAIFATLISGCMTHRLLRSRSRSRAAASMRRA
jgi:hypothetical protein